MKRLLLGTAVGIVMIAACIITPQNTQAAENSVGYSITVPSTLDISSGSANYSVSVQGDVASYQTVKVEPTSTSFTLSDSSSASKKKANITATVSQITKEFTSAEVKTGASQTGSIKASLSAGTWKGMLSFTSTIINHAVTIDSGEPGLYDDDGIQTLSWDKLLENTELYVEGTSLGNSYRYDNPPLLCALGGHLIIPDGITSIGVFVKDWATFYGMKNLKSIKLPDSITSICDQAFSDCYGLTSFEFPSGMTRLACPNGDDLSFCEGSSITTLIIPSSITYISEGFFACIGHNGGPNSATTINYKGSQSQWNAIVKAQGWDNDLGEVTINYNYAEN